MWEREREQVKPFGQVQELHDWEQRLASSKIGQLISGCGWMWENWFCEH